MMGFDCDERSAVILIVLLHSETNYLLYTMENTSSNQRGAVGLLIDGLCAGGEGEIGSGRGNEREREFVTDVQPFERKLNKYLIRNRWAAAARSALSQFF